ncbi:hypothetical protein B0H10DRAFT_2271309 [Mycena sp. CBHHK59/15]|nr:hypothetical protein B0H10DRAFT_2271309 [Mycena sp. CBHHK59/15]
MLLKSSDVHRWLANNVPDDDSQTIGIFFSAQLVRRSTPVVVVVMNSFFIDSLSIWAKPNWFRDLFSLESTASMSIGILLTLQLSHLQKLDLDHPVDASVLLAFLKCHLTIAHLRFASCAQSSWANLVTLLSPESNPAHILPVLRRLTVEFEVEHTMISNNLGHPALETLQYYSDDLKRCSSSFPNRRPGNIISGDVTLIVGTQLRMGMAKRLR